MTRSPIPLPQVRGFLQTQRTDYWWIQPILVLLGLGGFVVYSTWAAFQGCNYFIGGVDQPGVQRLLSPFYSPVLWDPRECAPAPRATFPVSHPDLALLARSCPHPQPREIAAAKAQSRRQPIQVLAHQIALKFKANILRAISMRIKTPWRFSRQPRC